MIDQDAATPRCIICRSRPAAGTDGWCGHCLTSYLDGWMPLELVCRVHELWGLKMPDEFTDND